MLICKRKIKISDVLIERKFIEDLIIKYNISKYLSKALVSAGFSRVEIQKTPMITRIIVYVLNPGRVIGRGGRTLDILTDAIKKKFNIENPQINIIKIENRFLDPMIVAKNIANKFERGLNTRKIIKQTLRSILENGAIGAEIIVSGKLAAKKARAKTLRKSVGYVPKAGDTTKLVRYGVATACPKYGAIGVKVKIVPEGTVFPDRKVKKLEIPKQILKS